MKILITAALLSFIAMRASQGQTPTDLKPDSAKKLEFEDQSISALDPDYGKLDLTSLKDKSKGGGRLYPIRTSFKKEQGESMASWGIAE